MLMYYNDGDHAITREQLQYIPTPAPLGPRHKPVSFYDYASSVIEKAEEYGLEPSGEEYCLDKTNMKMFGVINLSSKVGTGYGFMLGLRGSHDRSIPRGLAIGSRVFVCSNLCFSGDLGTVKTKQTTFIDDRLMDFIKSGMDMVANRMEAMDNLYNSMKDTTITIEHGDNVLNDMFRRNILPAADLGTAIKEWAEPKYKDHAEYGDSIWKLFNACTQAIKPRGANVNMFTVAERSRKIHNHIEEEFFA